jgi:hypothetical protein
MSMQANLTMLENDRLHIEVAPGIGGRIVSLREKPSGEEWLWRNPGMPLRRVPTGTAYDPEFYGGVDEQIPCDGPETVDGVTYPDHGELWTQALDAERNGAALLLRGRLPLLGFHYERKMALAPDSAAVHVDYRLTNTGSQARAFLWKLHAALAIAPNDRIICPAAIAQPLDLAWSRCLTTAAFAWPHGDARDMSQVPPPDGTAEFLALTGLSAGWIGLRRARTGRELRLEFDPAVFPCCWFFASYGKLLGHYTAVLEPATSASLTVADDPAPARLAPGETLVTHVRYRVIQGDTPCA